MRCTEVAEKTMFGFILTQREQFLQYSQYIRTKPDLDSPLVTQAADFFKVRFM